MKTHKMGVACLLCSLFFFTLFGIMHADEETEVWARLYRSANTLQQKYEIMLNIVGQQNRDMTPVLIEALDELIQQSLYLDRKEKVVLNDLKMLVVKELGELRAREAAEYIFTVVLEADDPQLKGEALIALGKTGEKKYARDIAMILRNLTLYRGDDPQADEVIAYGCVLALERMKEPVGYLPVFFATTAGFSRKVKDAAESALVTIRVDPSDILKGLIINESSFEMKLEGLKAENRSNAPDGKKGEVAIVALNEGLANKPHNQDEESILRELRRLALEMIIDLKVQSVEALPLIERVLYLNTDDNEKTFAIEALRSISGDDASSVLSRYLAYQNERQQSGVTAKDNRIVIATIRALGNMNSNVGYEELLRAKYAGYPASVKREADKALKAIGR